MAEVIVVAPKVRRTKGSKKLKRSARDKMKGKYKRRYDRTVARTGRWRGKKV